MTAKADALFERVTADMIAAIESGAGEWEMPWMRLARAHVSNLNRPYRGFNVWILADAAARKGVSSNQWGTYRAWSKMGEGYHVARGETGTEIILWKQATRKPKPGEDKPTSYLLATTFHVFAREQVRDADDVPLPELDAGVLNDHERLDAAEKYFAEIGADWREGGDRAYYAPVGDYIAIPQLAQFDEPASFYSTLAHEHVHWTGHESRLKRELRNRFGDEAYAMEELVAELGAAFFSAQMGIAQAKRKDHSSYLSHWLSVLKADPKALLSTSSKAQAALDYLNRAAGYEIADDE
jgi:antirestriction protein ArdC